MEQNKSKVKKDFRQSKEFWKNLWHSLKVELLKIGLVRFLNRFKNSILLFLSSFGKLSNIVKSNFDLGKKHLAQGNFGDAIFRFKIVVWLEPEQAAGWYFLGKTYFAYGNKVRAEEALKKAIAIKPDFQEAAKLLSDLSDVPQDKPEK